ncbi:hypothetical protein KQX64_17905 [Rhodopseudomonas palustris]|nr:hypothetical protein KQX64_17905 [Rhodopseudomonas palustris]
MKNPTPIVQMAAFVMPIHDYAFDDRRDDFLYIPSEAGNADNLGWQVWGWNLRRQTWVLVGTYEDLDEAERDARNWHERVMAKVGANPYCPDACWSPEDFQNAVAEWRALDAELAAEEAEAEEAA